MEKVLAIGAHPDDEVLGVGGSLARHVDEGDEVHVLLIGEGPLSREGTGDSDADRAKLSAKKASKILGVHGLNFENFPDNRFDEKPRLDLVKCILGHIERIKPSIVYTHHYKDLNIDHRYTSEAVQVACRALPGSPVKAIYFWETLSSTEWAVRRNSFYPQFYVDISKQLDRKLKAMKEYADELREYPHPRSFKGIEALAQVRGMESGFMAAEAFEVFRILK